MKYCAKCCKGFSDELTVCPECNGNLIEYNQAPVQPVTENNTVTEYAVKPKSKVKIWLIILMAAIVAIIATACVFAVRCIINEKGKQELRIQLLRDWSRIEQYSDTYYTLELDFSDNEIDYNFVDEIYGLIDETIATYEYEVISPNEISVDKLKSGFGTTYKIEFNDEKSMMIITPSLTNSDSKEYWYHH